MTRKGGGGDRRRQAIDQDDVALPVHGLRAPIQLRVVLSPDEREAIARSKAAAERGESATDEQVRTVWTKHRL
jgi:hypothetical protein